MAVEIGRLPARPCRLRRDHGWDSSLVAASAQRASVAGSVAPRGSLAVPVAGNSCCWSRLPIVGGDGPLGHALWLQHNGWRRSHPFGQAAGHANGGRPFPPAAVRPLVRYRCSSGYCTCCTSRLVGRAYRDRVWATRRIRVALRRVSTRRPGSRFAAKLPCTILPRLIDEHGEQGDLFLVAPDLIPRDPDIVRCAQIRFTVVSRKLFGGKDILACWSVVGRFGRRVVVRIDDQFAVDGNHFAFGVVEVDSSAEAACRRLARMLVDRIGPHGDDPLRALVAGLLFGAATAATVSSVSSDEQPAAQSITRLHACQRDCCSIAS